MTNEKAREYFSAYSEGTLDAGLAQSFEVKLKADQTLRAEYEQFEATLKKLESLRFEQIEVPFDLNDRISAAVDKSIYDKKRTAQPGWALWLRNFAFAGLAAGAVFGAYLSINRGGDDGSAKANILDIRGPKSIEQVEFSRTPKGVGLEYKPTEKHTISIRGGDAGEQKFETGKELWLHELKNSQPDSALFEIDVQGEVPATVVIVPGTIRNEIEVSQGTVAALAQEIADKFGVPVVLKTSKAQVEISWTTLDGSDALKTSEIALQNLNGVVADMREGILYIGDN